MLAILGATPGLLSVVIFEGTSRLLNAAGQLVPGKLGVLRGDGATIRGLCIGSAHGLSLALARRAFARVERGGHGDTGLSGELGGAPLMLMRISGLILRKVRASVS